MKNIIAVAGIFIVLLCVSFSTSSHAKDMTGANYHGAPQSISLSTQSGIEIGGQVSGYHYQENASHGRFLMEENGPKFGITAAATKAFNYGIFGTFDGRFAYGQNEYTGNGTKNDVDDFLFDGRFLAGKDFVFDSTSGINWSISPYVGIGYRNLLNDLRGTTSTGAHGYRRDSQYLYLPVGITPRFRVSDNARISTNLEYDYLIQGWQTSSLGDASASASDVNNTQHTGYGLRASVMYEWSVWSVGPFANYWNVNQSDTACSSGICGFEPHNHTIEGGLQFRYRF